jgi:hypothetical protein
MRVFSEIDPDTYDRIEEAVHEGKYRDVDQFIRVAIQNQFHIENFDGKQPQSDSTTKPQPTNKSDNGYSWGYSVPENPPISSPYEMERSNKLLFQQYYRYFPLIPVMVELAEVTAETGEPVMLDEFRNHIDKTIEPLRDAIINWEEQNNVKKKNRKSTGFPKVDVKNPKYSKKRYLDHFVGKVRKRDLEPKSFGHSLGFISYESLNQNKTLIQLTPAGKRLLEYENPLLSNGPTAPVLSDEEQKYIIGHLESTLDSEFRLMEFICSTIADNGKATYTNRLGEFKSYLVSEGELDSDASEERVRSHVAGALSRMVELGILKRGSKRGVYVTATPPKEFLDELKSPT